MNVEVHEHHGHKVVVGDSHHKADHSHQESKKDHKHFHLHTATCSYINMVDFRFSDLVHFEIKKDDHFVYKILKPQFFSELQYRPPIA